MKQAIDIEDLLIWAYRDMQADRLGDGGGFAVKLKAPCSWAAVEHFGTYGTFVQASDYEPEPGDRDDAALIHRAVLGLDDAFLSCTEQGVSVWDRALIQAEGCDLVEERQSRPQLRQPGGELLPLDRVVISVYLVLHARQGSRPDCYSDVTRRRGRPRKDGEIADGITFDDVQHHRAVYSVWHAALGILAADLAGRLAKWDVTGPKADEAPWLQPARRVLEAQKPKNKRAPKPMKRRRKLPS
ncbi:hypothetical protein AncyloWKF20_05205 [Ancylobacter sp. WKF20]|uniref:hypothetical protein n=1 Tax=Ancylobacter sp. WKF20 TaxID=3039801 RepID=UPI0024343E6E|nr:hypothetical protein [Ancylobacter sp. WKF20]WGD31222.1 hypothetical protein AncyloWKF20_05205 [Ancylobacter sp. WKF20]